MSASAASSGDPHATFDGTTPAGTKIGGNWDSMTSHANLLESDSFDGGYRISTTVTQPNDTGVTLNARVSVATDGGRTNVSLSGDGAYDVWSSGRRVALETGRTTRLGDGETVTRNADGSLSLSDRNGRGGSIETTLRHNGAGGVDVENEAHRVGLGGYLVDRTDGDANSVVLAGPDEGASAARRE